MSRVITASILDDLGVPIGAIQRILGHQNRKTTEIYLHSVGEAERNAMEKLEHIDLFSDANSLISKAPTNMHASFWQRKTNRPSYDVLKRETEELGYVGTGKKYGVSDNAVRKWIKYYENHQGLKTRPEMP